MIDVSLEHPWLSARLNGPHRCLSWAPYRAGFQTTDHVLWREVRNADLTPEYDAIGGLAAEMAERNTPDAVAMMTSREVATFRLEAASLGRSMAQCLATVGLSNALRVNHAGPSAPIGTINLLVVTNTPLLDTGLIEALSIATEARTAAVMDHGPMLTTGQATGTGTDCIVVAAPPGDQQFAGLHTDVGQSVGAAVYAAISAGTQHWMETEGKTHDA